MINISGCQFDEFKDYMCKEFGEDQFTQGFEIIQKNRFVAFEYNGEERLQEMLSHLKFADREAIKGFINFCTTYLIVQNMKC